VRPATAIVVLILLVLIVVAAVCNLGQILGGGGT
jgi:hypothetical protein